MSTRLAIVTTHPIQYNAPLFQLLAQQEGLHLKIFYTWGQSKEKIYDPGFGKNIRWDIPLLEGYDAKFLTNTAKVPGTHHFWGIINPDAIEMVADFLPDAILVYGWSFYSHLKILYTFKGKIPVFFRGDSHLLNETATFSFKKLFRHIALLWVYKYIDKAFYVGQANKAYYLRHGLRPDQLVFAPHAIDNRRFEANQPENEHHAQEWRAKLGIAAHEITFMFVGKLEAIKNVNLLISAFKKLVDVNTRLILVGTGPDEPDLKKQAAGDRRILFLGFQNQDKMPMVYRMSDVLVLPSISETWGLSVNEAFACSRPAIVSDKVGCGQDLILHQQTGWIFNLHQENGLVEALNQALQQGSAGLSRMGQQAQKLITNWSYTQTVAAINQALTHAH